MHPTANYLQRSDENGRTLALKAVAAVAQYHLSLSDYSIVQYTTIHTYNITLF